MVAIPVREASEPSERLQPLPLSAPTPVSARYTPTEEGDVWHATVQQLVAAEAITALVRELALQSQLVARDGAHWLLRVERESLNQPTARERLRAALEAAGYATQISVEVGRVIDSPARRNAGADAAKGSGYKECGCGMGPALNIAASSGAYALADRGTWLNFKNRADLAVLVEGDTRLFNQYGVMVVNPARHPHVKAQDAQKFVDWVVSPAGQTAIANYKIGGEQLFFPNAAK